MNRELNAIDKDMPSACWQDLARKYELCAKKYLAMASSQNEKETIEADVARRIFSAALVTSNNPDDIVWLFKVVERYGFDSEFHEISTRATLARGLLTLKDARAGILLKELVVRAEEYAERKGDDSALELVECIHQMSDQIGD